MKYLLFSLASASILFGESYRPNQKLPECYPALVNQTANVEVACGWDVFATGSFIYWHASQDYMDAGRSASFGLLGATPESHAHSLYPEFSYNPGFKVGWGVESVFDHWNLSLEYTWLHQKTSNSTGAVPAAVVAGDKIWIPNDWFNTLTTGVPAQQAAQIRNHWKMHFDQLDLTAALPFYEGPEVVIYHYGGVRGMWIRQQYTIDAVLAQALASPAAISKNTSKCWSVGPLVGIGGHSIFKWGFYVEGRTKMALVYTRFTDLSHSENDQGFGGSAPIAGSMADYGCIRPTSEVGLGIGWGSYFSKNRFHADIAFSYDFEILWNQNMMRQTVGSLGTFGGYANMAGHLYLHGLTVDARLNF